jgi:hypothetical protein
MAGEERDRTKSMERSAIMTVKPPAQPNLPKGPAAPKIKGPTDRRVREAMRAIERDVIANDGIYPFCKGLISLQEVLRRASLSKYVLEKKRHASLKAEVTTWVENATKKTLRGMKDIRPAVTQRSDDANEKIRAIQQAWHEAELEYIDMRSKFLEMEIENNRLKTELRVYKSRL